MIKLILQTLKNFKNNLSHNTHNRLLVSSIIALYLVLFFNLHQINTYGVKYFIGYILPLFVTAVGLTFLFSFNRFVLAFFTLVMSACTSGFVIAQLYYKIDVNMNLIVALLNTNSRESTEHFSFVVLFGILFFSVIPAYIVSLIKFNKLSLHNIFSKHNGIHLAKSLVFFVILLVISFVVYPKEILYHKNKYIPKASVFIPLNYNYYPVKYIQPLVKYKLVTRGNHTYKDLTPYNIKFVGNAATKNNQKQAEPLIVVMFIGESARNKSFSLGGYQRNTNPMLSKINNLVYFKNTTSCYTGTIASVTCMLSSKTNQQYRQNMEKNYKNQIESVVDVFALAGFTTNFLTTSSYRPGDPIFLRFAKVNNIEYLAASKLAGHARDELVIPAVENLLSNLQQNNNTKNQFIAIHTFGSHYKYRQRYHPDFEKFNPICHAQSYTKLEDCTIEQLVNEYDNTILYTDYVVATVIEKLKNKNAVFIYTSDHGESIGENGRFYHGVSFNQAPVEQTNVPMLIWFSNKYLQTYGNSALKNAKSKQNDNLSHSNIWHSLVNCGQVQVNQLYSSALSLCSAK